MACHSGLDVFAPVVAIVSFAILQRFKPPIYLLVTVGAVLGMLWTLALGVIFGLFTELPLRGLLGNLKLSV
jgi:UPF0716 family protein affecting phage T7 exclusion